MLRILAVAAFIVAIILMVVVAIGSNVDPHITDWAFVSAFAGLLCWALEGVSLPRGPA
jgi:hypothetical protein